MADRPGPPARRGRRLSETSTSYGVIAPGRSARAGEFLAALPGSRLFSA